MSSRLDARCLTSRRRLYGRRLAAVAAALLLAACAQTPQMEEAPPPDAAAIPDIVVIALAPTMEAPTPPPAPAVAALPDAPPPPPSVWDRVRTGFRLPNLEGKLVQDWERYYSSRPDYVARIVDRGSRFLFHVMEEVERRNMPAEIALLPMIESAYNPKAYSRAHASGMWQFIPSTGKIYGLRQDFWYDGRRDVLAATGAALEYLEKLHGMFGDWKLALAAYNWGEGAVSRAIARNQARGLPTDYGSLPMPAETRNYIPKLQAVKNIVADPERFGITLADVPNQPYFATVTTSHHIDLKLAATLAEMSLEDFRFLNPAHNKPVIKADGSETIVLPVDKVEAFQRNLAAHDRPFVTWHAYTVKRSDRPEAIAARHGISLAELNEANSITGNRRIVAGQTILVPLRDGAKPHLPDLPAPKIAPARYQRPKGRCTMMRDGVRVAVPCAPAKKKPVTAARKPAPKPKR